MKAIHRTTQWVMCRSTGMLSHEPEVIRGEGSLHKVPEMLKTSGKTRVLVVTTPGFIRRGSLQGFMDELKTLGIDVSIFNDVVPDPTIECIEALATAYVLGQCQAIVAIGGGSVIDSAKAAAARIVRPEKSIRDMKGIMKIRRKLPDFYAVPTTAGTGSEATAASVVTDTVDGKHYKYAVNDTCLIPRYAVLDPVLSADLPSHMTAATGMDALTHAVEAYTNRFPSQMVKDKAKDAVKLIFEYLPAAYRNGRDMVARDRVLLASYEAGVAFTNNFVGYVHAVAHGIGALYGVPHGFANAIILPYVMEQFGEPAHKALAELAEAAGILPAQKTGAYNRAEAAGLFIETIRKMNADMDIPDFVEELKEEDFDTIIERAISEANYTYPVPVIWDREEFGKLLKQLTPTFV